MRKVFKYTLAAMDRVEIEMPKGAETLTAREQGAEVCMWALVDPEAETEKRTFLLRGTGHNIGDEEIRYIGSAQLARGTLIFHVFEVVG